MDDDSISTFRGRRFFFALVMMEALTISAAFAENECSVLTSEGPFPFPYSSSALAVRNEFLLPICGGANGDIYLPWDSRIKGRFERASKGYSTHDQLYPDVAKRQGLMGKVVVAAVVEMDGTIQHAAVIESSGHKVLDDAAMVWIKKNGFGSPAKLDGQPTRIMLYLPIEFKLTTLPKRK